jgi:hypothetical protein
MAEYYLIRGNQIIADVSASVGDATALALPLIYADETPLSLFNKQHAQQLMANLDLTPGEALAALGLTDLRSTMLKTIVVGTYPPSVPVGGLVAYRLIDINDYTLWQVDGQQDDLLALHAAIWQMPPIDTLGLLAVVQEFGISFYPAAVRSATGMTIEAALARRDRIATYLESLGYTNTTALRSATNEHAQMLGIVTALGYTETQMWNLMIE